MTQLNHKMQVKDLIELQGKLCFNKIMKALKVFIPSQ